MGSKGISACALMMAACAAVFRVHATDVPADAQIMGPDVDALLFTGDAVYLGSPGYLPALATDPSPEPGQPVGRWTEVFFKLDRKSGALTRVASTPADAQGAAQSRITLQDVNRDWSSAGVSYLTTSDGALYTEDDPLCGQVGNYGRLLTADCRPVEDVLQQGELATAVEEYGDYFLLGTTRLTQAATEGPGRGLLVLSRKDGKLVRRISQDDGLAEDIIRLVRRDPVNGHLWVETPRSLAELSPKFEVLRVIYLHVGFDATGVPSLAAGSEPEYDDVYARLALKLHVRDFSAYQKAIQAIPAELRGKLYTEVFRQGMSQGGPIPAAFEVLLPFVVADLARDPDPRQSEFALDSLCRFKDPRARQAADALLESPIAVIGQNAWYKVKDCADPAVAAAHRPSPPAWSTATPGQGGNVVHMTAYAARSGVPPSSGVTPGSHGTSGLESDPSLVIMSFSPPVLYWDGKHPLHLVDSTGDDGGGTAGPSLTRYYLSGTLPVDPEEARAIAEHPVPALGSGQSSAHAMDVMPPADLPHGIYYLLPCANADHRVPQGFDDGRCRLATAVIPRFDRP